MFLRYLGLLYLVFFSQHCRDVTGMIKGPVVKRRQPGKLKLSFFPPQRRREVPSTFLENKENEDGWSSKRAILQSFNTQLVDASNFNDFMDVLQELHAWTTLSRMSGNDESNAFVLACYNRMVEKTIVPRFFRFTDWVAQSLEENMEALVLAYDEEDVHCRFHAILEDEVTTCFEKYKGKGIAIIVESSQHFQEVKKQWENIHKFRLFVNDQRLIVPFVNMHTRLRNALTFLLHRILSRRMLAKDPRRDDNTEILTTTNKEMASARKRGHEEDCSRLHDLEHDFGPIYLVPTHFQEQLHLVPFQLDPLHLLKLYCHAAKRKKSNNQRRASLHS